jgi:site-specific DNA-cytosine methylase
MLIFDFFSGTGSSTQAFKEAGHTVISFELDQKFQATENVDIMSLTSYYLLSTYGRPDFIWASPPCTAFSVASIGHHWTGGKGAYLPKTSEASFNQELVAHTRKLIEELNPYKGYLIENPRGMLRKLPPVQGLPRQTISYCQYGDTRQKPTDLFGEVKGWTPKAICKRGSPCHEAAPRGSRTGTQGLKNAAIRSKVAPELSLELLKVMS